ncbi:MAG: hypothetical protein ACREDD_03375 [Methylocella sp.]
MNARGHAQPIGSGFGPEPGADTLIRLPPIQVRTDRGEVAGFLRETGGVTGGFVPLTFPVRWLALPAVRGLIMQLTGGQGFLPVHEGQSFAYEHELRIETNYVLAIEARRAEQPPRLTLRMAIATAHGEICARSETLLRIVPLNLEPAS